MVRSPHVALIEVRQDMTPATVPGVPEVYQSRTDSLGVVDSMDEFMERRRRELAVRTVAILRELANNLDIEMIERELHRIVGTCGTFGLMDGSRGAADLLARVRQDSVGDLANELNVLAEVFARSAIDLEH